MDKTPLLLSERRQTQGSMLPESVYIEKQAKLTYAVKNQDSDYTCMGWGKDLVIGREYKGGFWGTGKVLFHGLSAGHTGVFRLWKLMYTYDICTLLFVYYTEIKVLFFKSLFTVPVIVAL